jgi:hypothetical protein
MKQLEPVGNHAATLRVGSDCYPYEIVKQSDKTVVVRRVDAQFDIDAKDYLYFSCPNAATETYTYRKNGRLCKVGDTMNGCGLSIGRMRMYQDPHF